MLDERQIPSLGRVDFKGGYLLVPGHQARVVPEEIAAIRENTERHRLTWMNWVGVKPGCSRVMREFSLGGCKYIAKSQPASRHSKIIDELMAASFVQSLLPRFPETNTFRHPRLAGVDVKLAAEQPVAGIVMVDESLDLVKQALSVFRWVPGVGGHENEMLRQTTNVFGIPARDLDIFLQQLVSKAFEYFRANGLTWYDAGSRQTIVNRISSPQIQRDQLQVTLVDFESCRFTPPERTVLRTLVDFVEQRLHAGFN